MTKELNYHFSELVKSWIFKYLKQGKRIWILVNKKWYSWGVICHKCGFTPQCTKCSVNISFYQLQNKEKIWLCHICKTQYRFPTKCEQCGSEKIKEFGLGTQKVAESLEREFGAQSVIIESGLVNSVNKIQKMKEKILKEKPQIIIGTSLLTTPIQWYPLDLIIFLNADFGLNVPDFTANEKNFWFLYEAFTKHSTQNFLVQTFNPEHYSIRSACKLDEIWFFEQENEFKKANKYPPFAELCIILYKNEIEKRVFSWVDKLYKELLFLQKKYELENDIEIYATPPLVYKIWGKYRYNIILKWTQVRNFMDIVYSKLRLQSRGFKVDWEATTIV